MPRIDALRAIVRPFCIIYSMMVLSVLVVMQMSGYPIPTEGTADTIVKVFLAITGLITTEYAVERGAQKLLDSRNTRFMEQLKMLFLETEAAAAVEKTDANS